ncbi:MAG TPA: pyridoxine 5'-phosphate synthase [Gammaproteobacteria bacterium]|nr:pyridoxine 5'-phosphate synthase [Gammaproteobacteria bacterium]
MTLLGVNIDHVATIRQTRGTAYPDILKAALDAEAGGADGITVHLREDRRHIQLDDVEILKKNIKTRLNLEMAATDEMVKIAQRIKPAYCCIVPEKRQELTTEGGLDVLKQEAYIKQICAALQQAGIQVSLFIDPDNQQIDAAHRVGAPLIEIHTGEYNLPKIKSAAAYAQKKGLIVNAGHGLNYDNVNAIAAIPGIYELNIGHSIVAEALFSGMKNAVHEMKRLVNISAK